MSALRNPEFSYSLVRTFAKCRRPEQHLRLLRHRGELGDSAGDSVIIKSGLKGTEVIATVNSFTLKAELGKGEALVSFLEGNGTPSMVERTLICPPSARVGPISPQERRAVMAKSPVKGKYDQSVDPESAYEQLQKRIEATAEPGPPAGTEEAGQAGGLLGGLGQGDGGGRRHSLTLRSLGPRGGHLLLEHLEGVVTHYTSTPNRGGAFQG